MPADRTAGGLDFGRAERPDGRQVREPGICGDGEGLYASSVRMINSYAEPTLRDRPLECVTTTCILPAQRPRGQ